MPIHLKKKLHKIQHGENEFFKLFSSTILWSQRRKQRPALPNRHSSRRLRSQGSQRCYSHRFSARALCLLAHLPRRSVAATTRASQSRSHSEGDSITWYFDLGFTKSNSKTLEFTEEEFNFPPKLFRFGNSSPVRHSNIQPLEQIGEFQKPENFAYLEKRKRELRDGNDRCVKRRLALSLSLSISVFWSLDVESTSFFIRRVVRMTVRFSFEWQFDFLCNQGRP